MIHQVTVIEDRKDVDPWRRKAFSRGDKALHVHFLDYGDPDPKLCAELLGQNQPVCLLPETVKSQVLRLTKDIKSLSIFTGKQ